MVNIATVLMVDDDPHIRRIAQLVMVRLGPWQVSLAASGKEAVELIDQLHPDVVLLDVMMPEMDGPTTFARFREIESCRDIPVIFMTAKVLRHEVDSYRKLGAAGVISKPFDPKSLPDEIRSLVRSWNGAQTAGCSQSRGFNGV